jgi:hypothetical protein
MKLKPAVNAKTQSRRGAMQTESLAGKTTAMMAVAGCGFHSLDSLRLCVESDFF